MPFDGVDYQDRRERPRRGPACSAAINLLVALLATCLGVLPFSIIVVIDTVRYFGLSGPPPN